MECNDLWHIITSTYYSLFLSKSWLAQITMHDKSVSMCAVFIIECFHCVIYHPRFSQHYSSKQLIVYLECTQTHHFSLLGSTETKNSYEQYAKLAKNHYFYPKCKKIVNYAIDSKHGLCLQFDTWAPRHHLVGLSIPTKQHTLILICHKAVGTSYLYYTQLLSSQQYPLTPSHIYDSHGIHLLTIHCNTLIQTFTLTQLLFSSDTTYSHAWMSFTVKPG